mmetsp:Transcript_36716/g.80488  ORF Transcript_36716/g.80488 Transcript_36716/m.80488 type:complete len:228 (+) Transcript_36716:578-1261(+)
MRRRCGQPSRLDWARAWRREPRARRCRLRRGTSSISDFLCLLVQILPKLLPEGLVVLLDQLWRHILAFVNEAGGLLAGSGLLLRNLHGIDASISGVLVVERHPLLLRHVMQRRRLGYSTGIVPSIGLCHLHVVRKGLSERSVNDDEVALRWCRCMLPLDEDFVPAHLIDPQPLPGDLCPASHLWVLLEESLNMLLQEIRLSRHRLAQEIPHINAWCRRRQRRPHRRK